MEALSLVDATSQQQSSQKLHALRRRFEKFRTFLNQRFHWEIAEETALEEEEEGEYAPIVVELPDTE